MDFDCEPAYNYTCVQRVRHQQNTQAGKIWSINIV